MSQKQVPAYLDQMLEHARLQAGVEACGLLLSDESGELVYKPTHNLHPDPRRAFLIDPKAIARAHLEGWRIEAVFHSHWYSTSPGQLSHQDKLELSLWKERIPLWILLDMPSKKFSYHYAPSP